MREIKFAVGIENMFGEVSEVILTIDELLDKGLKYQDCDILHKRQYTGLKDKNGVEIYEGNAVKAVPLRENDFEEWSSYVEWNNSMLRFECNGEPLGGYESFELEVIGNIHQHQHLLEQ